jgi:hypothetical protein
LLVDPHTNRHTEQAVEWLRPEWIDLEHWGLHGRALRLSLVLKRHLAGAEANDDRDERRATDKFVLLYDFDHGRLPSVQRSERDGAARRRPCKTSRGPLHPFVMVIIGERFGLVSAIESPLT